MTSVKYQITRMNNKVSLCMLTVVNNGLVSNLVGFGQSHIEALQNALGRYQKIEALSK